MLEAKGFRIKDFPEGDDLWRIDWMGNIHKNPPVPSEQLITIFLTKLNLPTSAAIYPLAPSALNTSYRKITEIGVGLLPLVWIGSVWRNGYRIDDGIVKYVAQSFSVDTTFAMPIQFSACSDPTLQSRLIPATEYPLGLTAWGKIRESQLFALPVNGDPYGMLIPAIEVIRFYYIFSSSSARALFYDQYASLINDPECNMDMPLPSVKLTLDWIAQHGDAWVLARYLASELVKSRVGKIYDWVQLNSMKYSEKGLNQSLFPFDGVTKLGVQGMYITGDDGNLRFLVTRLRRCSHPMPYSDVTIRVRKKPDIPEEVENLKPIWYQTWPKGLELKKLPYTSDQESDRNLFKIRLEANEERFESLRGRKLIKEYIPAKPKTHKRVPIKSDKKKRGLGTSEGTYSESDALSTEVTQTVAVKSETPSISFFNFIYALKYLRSSGLKVSTIQVGKSAFERYGEIISLFTKQGTSDRQWGVIQNEEHDPRGMFVAVVRNHNGCAYVMEIERDPHRASERFSVLVISSKGFSKDFTDIPDSELESLMQECQLYGRWPPESAANKYKRESAPHRKHKDDSTNQETTEAKPQAPDAAADPDLGRRILAALGRLGLVI